MKDTRTYLAAVGLRESLQRRVTTVWSTNTNLLTKEHVSLIMNKSSSIWLWLCTLTRQNVIKLQENAEYLAFKI